MSSSIGEWTNAAVMSNNPMYLASFWFLLAANANSARATASGEVAVKTSSRPPYATYCATHLAFTASPFLITFFTARADVPTTVHVHRAIRRNHHPARTLPFHRLSLHVCSLGEHPPSRCLRPFQPIARPSLAAVFPWPCVHGKQRDSFFGFLLHLTWLTE